MDNHAWKDLLKPGLFAVAYVFLFGAHVHQVFDSRPVLDIVFAQKGKLAQTSFAYHRFHLLCLDGNGFCKPIHCSKSSNECLPIGKGCRRYFCISLRIWMLSPRLDYNIRFQRRNDIARTLLVFLRGETTDVILVTVSGDDGMKFTATDF